MWLIMDIYDALEQAIDIICLSEALIRLAHYLFRPTIRKTWSAKQMRLRPTRTKHRLTRRRREVESRRLFAFVLYLR